MNALWSLLLAGTLVAWAVLDGANQGLGAHLRRLGRTPAERRTMLTALGPFLLAGEVWLVGAAGVLLAGYPRVEKDLWAAAYPLVVALLVAWVLRDAGVWLRSRRPGRRWRAGWEVVVVVASTALPAVAGALLGAALTWLPGSGAGAAARVVVPLLLASATVAGTRTLGALLTARRTTGLLHGRAVDAAAAALPWTAGLLATSAAGWAVLVPSSGAARAVLASTVLAAGAACALLARRLLRAAPGRARALVAVAAASPLLAAGATLGPRLADGSASGTTLALVGPVLACAVPVLVAAQAWVWWTFRRPVGPRDAVFW